MCRGRGIVVYYYVRRKKRGRRRSWIDGATRRGLAYTTISLPRIFVLVELYRKNKNIRCGGVYADIIPLLLRPHDWGRQPQTHFDEQKQKEKKIHKIQKFNRFSRLNSFVPQFRVAREQIIIFHPFFCSSSSSHWRNSKGKNNNNKTTFFSAGVLSPAATKQQQNRRLASFVPRE
jgi:hypothetical protein